MSTPEIEREAKRITDNVFYMDRSSRMEEALVQEITLSLTTLLTTHDAEVVKALTKEHYGISFETDTCIECSNHDRIKEALVLLTPKK